MHKEKAKVFEKSTLSVNCYYVGDFDGRKRIEVGGVEGIVRVR